MKDRLKSAFFTIENFWKEDTWITIIFTMWTFCLLVFLWFYIGIVIRFWWWFFITTSDTCTPSEEQKQVMERLDTLYQQNEYMSKLILNSK